MVSYLKYNDAEYPFVIDMGTIINYCELKDIEFTEYEKAISKPANLKLFFKESLKRGYYKIGKKFDLSDDQVLDILSDNIDFFAKAKTKATAVESDDSKKNES